jgi:hypothetical protein
VRLYVIIFIILSRDLNNIDNVILYNNRQNHQEAFDISECENPSFVKEKKEIC